MQLFIVSKDPEVCARYLDDRRVRKILIESAQMLCTSVAIYEPEYARSQGLMKPFNPKHPVVQWVSKTRANWMWTLDYHLALCAEYRRRFNKTHAVEYRLRRDQWLALAWALPDGILTTPANAARRQELGIDFTHIKPVTRAYREYLNARWLQEAEIVKGHYAATCTLPALYHEAWRDKDARDS